MSKTTLSANTAVVTLADINAEPVMLHAPGIWVPCSAGEPEDASADKAGAQRCYQS